MADINICVFGDSIVWGAGDPTHGGWAEKLKTNLMRRDSSNLCALYNLGISADTTDELLKRFQIEARARKPNILLFGIGINDACWRRSEKNTLVSKENFRKNLHQLITWGRELTPKIAFIGLTRVEEKKVQPYPGSSSGKSYSNKIIEEYDQIVREVNKAEKLSYIDLSKEVPITDLTDGLHPNTVGHEKVFRKVKSFLEKSGWID
jgi:lysophospholipase L1-like esterase